MAPTRLRERDGVLAAIGRGVQRAREGHGAAVLVQAEAGLGKTAVLDAAVDAAGLAVAFGRGEAMEGFLPFGLAHHTLVSVGASDVLDPAGPAVEPGAPFQRMLRWLEARDAPLLIALDDLHWSDPDSLSLFAFVARRLERLPVLLVGTLRPWPAEAHAVWATLAAEGCASIERLEPLSPAAARDLLAERLARDVDDDVAARVWDVCSGNPLLLEQMALALARGEDVPPVAGAQANGEMGRLLLARFAGMDLDALRCVRAAAVLGTTFRPDLAAVVAGLDEPAIDRVFEALSYSGLVLDQGGGEMRFVHPFFASALYDDIAPAVRRRMHARCFAALADRGLDGEAAGHALRADLVGDERATEVLERVGRGAMAAGAAAVAERHLAAAVRFHADRCGAALRLAHAESLAATGRMDAAADACRRLLADSTLDWSERVDVLRLMGRALYLTGAADHGEGALAEAAEVAIRHGDEARAVRPLLDLSLSAWLDGGPARALPIAARARELAATAEAELRELAGATWGHLLLESGDPAGLAATDPVGLRLDNPGHRLDPAELAWPWAAAYQFAMNENYAGRYAQSEAVFLRARDALESAGAPNALATVQIHIANVQVRRGDLRGALREAARADELAELTPGVMPYAALMRAEALAWSGRLGESEELCRRAEDAASTQWFARLWLAHIRGMRELWQGDPRAAASLAVAEDVTRAVGVREPCHVQWQGHAIAAHLAAGRRRDAVRVLAWLQDCGGGLACPWPRVAASLGEAQLAEHDGDDALAERHFTTTLDHHAHAELPLYRVEALLAYGGFLRRRGRQAQARPHLAEAAALAGSCGAAGLASAARDELRLAGGKRHRTPADRDRLTSAEERVARLAAGGDSNAVIARRLQISVHTVESHLKRVYAKLGLRSRRELMLRNDQVHWNQ